MNFYECGNLVSVTIPTSVTWINEDAFERCSNLEHIYYEGTEEQWGKISIHSYNNKPFFSSKCRIHYKGSPNTSTVSSGKYGENLVWSDNGSGTLTISGTGKLPYCTYVEDMPWAYRRSTLKKIVIKEGVTSIGRLSFYDCVSVVSVVIPASVTYIGEDAFEHCSKLEHVYYAGTQSQWSEIKIDSSNNGYLYSSKCQIHANSTGPIETCTVTLNPNGGTVSKRSITVTPGKTYSGLPTPTRSGYTFSGWYTASSGGARVTASTTVTNSSNHTLYAHWTKSTASKTYTITLNANSGKVSPSSIKVSANKTYLSSLPTPTRSGYTFSGWYTSRTGGTKITSTTKATANRTIYAHWAKDTAPKTYLITFDPNGGSVFTRYAAVVNGGTYRSLPTPSYPGRHFAGWYTASSGGTKVTPQTKVSLTGNRTLYAHWTTSPVSVRSMESGSWRVTVPAGSRLALYGSETSAAQATSATISRDTALTCTRMAVLSNGTVRYYAKINSGSSYWFCYSDEMAVN